MYYCDHKGWEKSFTNKHSLKRHKTTHDPNKKFKCEVWFKSFSLPQYLKEHKVVHTSDRPFVWKFPGCKKSFRQAGKLSIHKKEHLNSFKPKTTRKAKKKAPVASLSAANYSGLFFSPNLSETWGFLSQLQCYCLWDQPQIQVICSEFNACFEYNCMCVPSSPLTSSLELPNPLTHYYYNNVIY